MKRRQPKRKKYNKDRGEPKKNKRRDELRREWADKHKNNDQY